MAGKKVLDRLRGVDRRLAERVSRGRIGTLRGRLYWQPEGGSRKEIDIYEFQDQGTGTAPWGGQETLGHRYSVQIDGDAWTSIRKLRGTYFVKPRDKDKLIPVDVEGETEPDTETYAQVTFKVKQVITHELGINLS
jgi:hypothetical protein